MYLIDSAFDPSSTAKDHVLPNPESGMATRKLNDGREFRIIKRFWEPQALAARLGELGWRATIAQTPELLSYTGSRSQVPRVVAGSAARGEGAPETGKDSAGHGERE